MASPQMVPTTVQGLRRRQVLKAGLVASAALSTRSLSRPSILWGAATGPPKRGGILRMCTPDSGEHVGPTRRRRSSAGPDVSMQSVVPDLATV